MLAAALKIFVLEACLLLSCLLGDFLMTLPVAKQHMTGALMDNIIHGIIGGVSWAVVVSHEIGSVRSLTECAVCMVLSMSVDIDHFLAARSIQLKDALSLKNRPPFHSSTLAIAVITLLVIYSVISKTRHVQTLTMLLTVAVFSHHVRDATRRGLWLPPIGSTSPIPKAGYIAVIMVLPVILNIVDIMWRDRTLKSTITYSLV